jgi:hypothetical protein
MSSLGDLMKDPNAFRGAADDLMRALRIGPQELGDLTVAITGQDPPHARAIVARHLLTKPVIAIEPARSRPKLKPGLGPQPQPHVQAEPPLKPNPPPRRSTKPVPPQPVTEPGVARAWRA